MDDSVVRSTAAQITAHALAQLIAAQRDLLQRQVRGDVARDAPPRLFSHTDSRTDLARSAVTTLEAVVIDERLLQRVQRSVRSEPFHGGDGEALILHGKR